ncbi:MAG: hypothetical protein IJ760_07845 [Bacteroidales bacterium]|nr:hypothetical protein [Bacteroidales bacterium]
MKKRLLTAAVAIAALATFCSCGSKLCYCYTPEASGVYESELYISDDLPCNSQSMGNRTCVEQHERMNPGDIAYTPGR